MLHNMSIKKEVPWFIKRDKEGVAMAHQINTMKTSYDFQNDDNAVMLGEIMAN